MGARQEVGAADCAVSVVIPTQDRWDFLPRALAAVTAQRGVIFEVLVVDDGSVEPHSSREGLSEDPRVQHLAHGSARGVASARNTGLRAARGRWVAFLDDDDVWAPDKLAEQIAAAEKDNAEFVFSSALVVEASGRLTPLRAPSADGLVERLLTANVIPAGSSNVVARTELVRRVGGFDERLHTMADWDLWLRLAQAGRAARCKATHLAYLEHPGSMHVGELSTSRELALAAEKHRDACRALGVTFLGAHLEKALATDLLREGRRLDAARALLRAARQLRDSETAVRVVAPFLGPRGKSLARRAWYGKVEMPEWLEAAMSDAPSSLGETR